MLKTVLFVSSLACVFGLVACGDPEVKKEDVEKITMDQLTAQAGKPSPQVTCPSGLKAKVGTTMVCTMPIDGKTYDVNIKVTSVEGSTAKFDIAVADKPH